MKKTEAIKYFISSLYEKNIKQIINKGQIKTITNFYKNNYKLEDTEIDLTNTHEELIKKIYKETIWIDQQFESMLNKDTKIKSMLKKSPSALCEIRKQFKVQKALQSGIISECYYTTLIAKIFGLNSFIDLETCLFNEVPPECINYINSNTLTFNCARYLYYNKKNLNIFIIQYGNPAEGDAEIIIYGNKIRLEFKEEKAKAGEYDIHYNEDGKLIITNEFKQMSPELSKLIEKFNNNTDIIENVGTNYKNLDSYLEMEHVKRYFDSNSIDVLISTNSANEFLAVTKDCLGIDKKIISTKDSEIRTAGRNHDCIFTPNYFECLTKDLGLIKIDNNTYKVLKKDCCYGGKTKKGQPVRLMFSKGKGKNDITRLKLNSVFFIKIADLLEDGDYYIIRRDKVRQLIPTISVHINVESTGDEIKEFYNKLNFED